MVRSASRKTVPMPSWASFQVLSAQTVKRHSHEPLVAGLGINGESRHHVVSLFTEKGLERTRRHAYVEQKLHDALPPANTILVGMAGRFGLTQTRKECILFVADCF